MAKTKTRTPAELMQADFEAVGRRDLDTMTQFWDAESVGVFHATGTTLRGPGEFSAFFHEYFTAFPDLEFEIVAIHPSGDDIAVGQWRQAGTFTGGPFQGLQPTGKRIEVAGIDVMQWDGETLRHIDVYYDAMTFARQAGVLPPADSGADKAMLSAFNAFTNLKRRLG